MNIYLAVNIVLMLVMAISMSQMGTRLWIRRNMSSHYYLYPIDETDEEISE
jgi:hypothetical protein